MITEDMMFQQAPKRAKVNTRKPRITPSWMGEQAITMQLPEKEMMKEEMHKKPSTGAGKYGLKPKTVPKKKPKSTKV